MKGDAVTTEEVDSMVFGVREMELHTDDEKVRASIAKDATPLSLKMAPVAPPLNPSLAEHGLENGLEQSNNDRRVVADFGQPLSEEALQKSGVILAVDIPMIDDDEDDEGTPIDDVVPANPPSAARPLTSTSGSAILTTTVNLGNGKPSNVTSCNGAAAKTKVESPSTIDIGKDAMGDAAAPVSHPAKPPATPLKSALKKTRNKSKKGHRVTFHDSRIFYIDTEAETTAEPQLLTVRSLELPMASSDYKIFIPNYEILPSLPRETGQSYTYEDAIVSLQRYKNDAAPPPAEMPATSTPICNGDTAAEAQVPAATTAPAEAAPSKEDNSGDADEETPSVSPPEAAVGDGQAEADVQPVQSLTEANLRQHEILMERDDVVDGSAAAAKEEPATVGPLALVASPVPLSAISAAPALPTVKNLSPPLKELSVDVSAGGAASWQVELSPLNSIPESETDDSSASSQDTIIMMTSEESRRNEEHIQQSTKSYQRQNGHKPASPTEERNGDTASTASSQDSDETLKCDESVDPGYVPPWIKGTAATLLDNGASKSGDVGLTLSQRTNSQIRQLMERNAVRRSLLRYSNTKKRATAAPPEDPPVTGGATIDKQRQWRSHESLLDTIKQLTVDDEEDEDDGDYEEILIHNDAAGGNHLPTYGGAAVANGYHHYRYSNGVNGGSSHHDTKEKTASNLSLQDIQRLLASPPRHLGSAALQQRRSQSSSNVDVDVPGDVRQWKIQATCWDEARRRHQRNGDETPVSPASLDYLQTAAPGGATDEVGDELAQFVQRDSGRIERLRKRYSYSDSGDYETVGAFARRSSVRGIKPRFGSTSEILKQMQSQLQPSPLTNVANGRSHMTWPYPSTVANADANGNGGAYMNSPLANHQHTMTIRTTVTSRSTNSLPMLKEEIYGILGAHRASQAKPSPNSNPIYATLPGRNHAAPPPPYQPPPPAPPSAFTPATYHQVQHQHHQAAPQRVYSKDERGVPEGASGSPKVVSDSIYGRTTGQPPPSAGNVNRNQVPTMADNSGVVYYVMQV